MSSKKEPNYLSLRVKSQIVKAIEKGTTTKNLAAKYNVTARTIRNIFEKHNPQILKEFEQMEIDRFGKNTTEQMNDEVEVEHTQSNLSIEWVEKCRHLNLSRCQIYEADVASLLWQQLPQKIYKHMIDKYERKNNVVTKNVLTDQQQGQKKLSFMTCLNATGTHKLDLLIIEDSQTIEQPIPYSGAKYLSLPNAQLTEEAFRNWFFRHFVPKVKTFLRSRNLPETAALLLVIPNYCHRKDIRNFEMSTEDDRICCTVTSRQNDFSLVNLLKLHYRTNMLRTVIIKMQTCGSDKMKAILQNPLKLTTNDMIINMIIAWKNINGIKFALSNSWIRKIFGEEDENYELNKLDMDKLKDEEYNLLEEIVKLLQAIEPLDYEIFDVLTWSKEDKNEDKLVADEFSSSSVVKVELDSDSDSDVVFIEEKLVQEVKSYVRRIPYGEAIDNLNVLIEWSQQNHYTANEILRLKAICEKAISKMNAINLVKNEEVA